MFETLSKAGKYLGQTARLMIGVPDYDNYVEHMRITHPDQTPMTYEEFFRERQDARYGGKAAHAAVKFFAGWSRRPSGLQHCIGRRRRSDKAKPPSGKLITP